MLIYCVLKGFQRSVKMISTTNVVFSHHISFFWSRSAAVLSLNNNILSMSGTKQTTGNTRSKIPEEFCHPQNNHAN